MKRKVGPKLRQELDDLTERLAQLDALSTEIDDMVAGIKARIIEINNQYDFPEETEKSQVYGHIRVTRPEALPFVDHKDFIEKFGLDTFLACWEITNAKMDVDKWTELVKEEAVTESDLRGLIQFPDTPSPRVTLIKKKKSE